MPRDLNTKNAEQAQAEKLTTILLADLHFTELATYVTTAPFNILVNANNYLGVGSFGSASAIHEVGDVRSTGVSLTLSGIDPSLVSIALNENYQGKKAIIYIGFLNEDENLVARPSIIYRGMMDVMSVQLGEQSSVSLTIESRSVALLRAKDIKFNNADQQHLFENDKALEFVEEMVEKEIVWNAS